MKKSILIKDYEKKEEKKKKVFSDYFVKVLFLFGKLLKILIIAIIGMALFTKIKVAIKPEKLVQEFNLQINNIKEGASVQEIFFTKELSKAFRKKNVPKGNLKITIENKTGEDFSPKIELVEKNGNDVSIVYEFDGKYYSAIETKDTVVKKDNKKDLIIYEGIEELQKAVQKKVKTIKKNDVCELEIGWFVPNTSGIGLDYNYIRKAYLGLLYNDIPVIFEVKVSNKI